MKKIALMFCLCLWGFFCVGCGDEKTVAENTPYQSMKLVMMTSGTANGIDTQIAGKIAEKVKEESKGAIIIEVYHAQPNNRRISCKDLPTVRWIWRCILPAHGRF